MNDAPVSGPKKQRKIRGPYGRKMGRPPVAPHKQCKSFTVSLPTWMIAQMYHRVEEINQGRSVDDLVSLSDVVRDLLAPHCTPPED